MVACVSDFTIASDRLTHAKSIDELKKAWSEIKAAFPHLKDLYEAYTWEIDDLNQSHVCSVFLLYHSTHEKQCSECGKVFKT